MTRVTVRITVEHDDGTSQVVEVDEAGTSGLVLPALFRAVHSIVVQRQSEVSFIRNALQLVGSIVAQFAPTPADHASELSTLDKRPAPLPGASDVCAHCHKPVYLNAVQRWVHREGSYPCRGIVSHASGLLTMATPTKWRA